MLDLSGEQVRGILVEEVEYLSNPLAELACR